VVPVDTDAGSLIGDVGISAGARANWLEKMPGKGDLLLLYIIPKNSLVYLIGALDYDGDGSIMNRYASDDW